MARVVDQDIPSEYRDMFERYVNPARPDTGVQIRKKRDGRKMGQTQRTCMQAFREGGRMWSTKSKTARQPWVDAGAALGLDGRSFFMKQWMCGILSVGPYEVGKSKIVGWGSTVGAYVTSRTRHWESGALIDLNVIYQIGYSIVGGEAQIS